MPSRNANAFARNFDVGAKRGFVVVPEGERFPLSKTVESIALAEFVDGLAELL